MLNLFSDNFMIGFMIQFWLCFGPGQPLGTLSRKNASQSLKVPSCLQVHPVGGSYEATMTTHFAKAIIILMNV